MIFGYKYTLDDVNRIVEEEKKKIIQEFYDTFKKIEERMSFELKNGTWNEDIKNNTKDKKYWKGYRYGIMAFWTDFVLPEKEKWEGRK